MSEDGNASLVVRTLVPADAETAYALRLRAVLEHPPSFHTDEGMVRAGGVEGMRSRLASNLASSGDAVLFGAFLDDALVGLTGLVREPRRKLRHKATVVSVYVRPDQRGRGVAGRLLDAALAHAAALDGVTALDLSVVAGNEPAIRLYASRGFVAWGTEPRALRVDGRWFDEVKMRREVGDGVEARTRVTSDIRP